MPDSLLDQSVPVEHVRARTLIREVDMIVDASVDAQNDAQICAFAGQLIGGIQLRGVSFCKLLYAWREHAEDFGIDPEDWVDYAAAKTGRSPETIYKYTDLWASVFSPLSTDNPLFWALLGKPIQGLLLLSAASKAGQLSDEDWDLVAEAEDSLTIRDIVRKARGEATSSKTRIDLVVGRDGVVSAWREEISSPVGYLNLSEDDELVAAAVTRILNAASIRRA